LIEVYGIPNCDTVKKVRKQLEAQGTQYQFIDFKKTPPSKKLLKLAKEFLGELPINRRGRTYRQHPELFGGSEAEVLDNAIENPSVIKRPIVCVENNIFCIGNDTEKLKGL
jgi:Spx/MgsR family transcriptional regulator